MAGDVQRGGGGARCVWVRWWAGARSGGRARAALRKLRERAASGAQRFPARPIGAAAVLAACTSTAAAGAAARCGSAALAAAAARTHAAPSSSVRRSAAFAEGAARTFRQWSSARPTARIYAAERASCAPPRQTLTSRWREIRVPERACASTEPSLHTFLPATLRAQQQQPSRRPDAAWCRRCAVGAGARSNFSFARGTGHPSGRHAGSGQTRRVDRQRP